MTGVPIGGRKELNILQNGNGDTNTATLQPVETRAKNYLAYKGLVGQISLEQAEAAANIVASWNWMNNPAPGAWSGFTAAPAVLTTSQQASISNINKYIFFGIVIVIIVVILIIKTKRK